MTHNNNPSTHHNHRMLIGTVMLSKNTGNSTMRSPVQLLKVERATVLTEVVIITLILDLITLLIVIILLIIITITI